MNYRITKPTYHTCHNRLGRKILYVCPFEKTELPSSGENSSSPDHTSSNSSISITDDLEVTLSSPQFKCNLLIPQLLQYNMLTNNLCNFCHLSIHLHHQTAERLFSPFTSNTSVKPATTSSSESSTKLLKSVITDLPIWRKPYKTCTPFFKALEQLFSVHDVTDELLFKRYLYLSLSELSDADKTYAFDHIINTSQSWADVKVSFSKRFEAYDYINKMRKQFHEIKYSSQDTIQTFSHRYINICSELAYDVNSQQIIHESLSHLPTDMHRRFLMRCESRDQDVSDFNTLDEIVLIITKLENAYHNAAFISPDVNKNHTNHGKTNMNKHVSSSTSKCSYYPDSKSHTTAECRLNPKNNHSHSHADKHNSPTSSPTKFSNFSSPGKTQPICHSCGMPSHYSSNCPNTNKSASSSSTSSSASTTSSSQGSKKPFVPSTMTRSAYVANNIKPTASINAIAPTSSSSSLSSSTSTTSDVSIKTIDRTIPIDVCSLDVSEHPTLLPIIIQGQLFYGLPDTGASSSCLDPLIPAKFGLTITPVKGKVKTADVRIRSDRIGTCDITAEIVIPDNNAKVKFSHTYEVFPIYEQEQGYHFIIGRDILGPLFNKGMSSSLYNPDPHVKLPTFYDENLAAVVNSMINTQSCKTTTPTSTINTSTLRFNCLVINDTVNIDINQSSIIQNELKTLNTYIAEDIQSLSSDIHDLGAGSIPDNEFPFRPSLHSHAPTTSTTITTSDTMSTSFDLYSTTPDSIKHQYSHKLNTLSVTTL